MIGDSKSQQLESQDQSSDAKLSSSGGRQGAAFATTQWSVVLAAGDRRNSVSRQALERLCRAYWYPLYVFVRRRGYSSQRAEDLTQSFFVHLIEKEAIAGIKPEGGRFRSYLLRSITNFLNNEHKYERSQKRGGHVQTWSIDFSQADHQYSHQPLDETTPDLMFERQWALSTLSQAKQLLAEEFADRPELYAALQPFISGDGSESSYREIADRIDLSPASLRVAVHRLRAKFRDKLRAVISDTVVTAEEIDDEINYLMSVFRR